MHLREMITQTNAALGSFWLGLAGSMVGRFTQAVGDGHTNLDRVYLFAGSFPDEAAMFTYCFSPIGANEPEQINLDLPEASVDTSLVDAAFGDQIIPRTSEYFDLKAQGRITKRLRDNKALVMIPASAFDGLRFRLHSTSRLRYIGFEKSAAAPTTWTLTS